MVTYLFRKIDAEEKMISRIEKQLNSNTLISKDEVALYFKEEFVNTTIDNIREAIKIAKQLIEFRRKLRRLIPFNPDIDACLGKVQFYETVFITTSSYLLNNFSTPKSQIIIIKARLEKANRYYNVEEYSKNEFIKGTKTFARDIRVMLYRLKNDNNFFYNPSTGFTINEKHYKLPEQFVLDSYNIDMKKEKNDVEGD